MIDRVIEIDLKEDRVPILMVRTVKTAPHREGIIPHEDNIKEDMIVLTNGLLAAILQAEKDGTFSQGEAIKKVIDDLQRGYVDAEMDVIDTRYDEQGNKV